MVVLMLSGAKWSVSGCVFCRSGELTPVERVLVASVRAAVRAGEDIPAEWPVCDVCRSFWDGMAAIERLADSP